MRDGPMLEITSLQNPKIKELVRLRKRSERDESSLFLIEGYRELKTASLVLLPMVSLFICPELFLGSNESSLIEAIEASGAAVYRCTPAVFEKISYRDRPDGLIAVAKQMKKTLSALPSFGEKALLLVAQSIEKPGNLGTMLRSADAVNCDGVISCDPCTDIYNPNVVRASTGTLFTRPVIEAATEETSAFLKQHGFKICAATPSAEHLFTEADLTGRVAIVVGTEQLGLTKGWLEEADVCVKIPMLGIADSLNVAAAATLLLYEVLRQRGL
jgi:RNA methyltransferase, TrmH family